jgi:glycosyltransferase involved in cell wall biosynthesis
VNARRAPLSPDPQVRPGHEEAHLPLKHVVIVYDFANLNGGGAKVAITNAELLADHGIGVTYFAGCGEPDPVLLRPGIEVIMLGQRDILSDPDRGRAALRGIWNPSAARELKNLLARHDPASTVVHCHGQVKSLSAAIGPVINNGPIRSLYTMHDYFLACPNGGFYDFQKDRNCTLKPLGARCITTNCDVRKPVHKAWRVARHAVAAAAGLPGGLRDIACISDLQKRLMAPWLPPTARLHDVPNPIEFGDSVDPSGHDLFLFVGRLNPEKGGTLFAEAVRRAGVRGVVVGDGAQAEAVRAIDPSIEITGWQSPAQVQTWIGHSRALVFPSLWQEPFGLVALEALCRGVPVVVGRWNAAAEFVENGVSGIIVDAPDADTMARALRAVSALAPFDPVPYRRRFSRQAHLDRLLEVYGEILDR